MEHSDYFRYKDAALVNTIESVSLPFVRDKDKLNWTHSMDGELTHKIAYAQLNSNGMRLPWFKTIWNNFAPPSRSFVAWRLHFNKLHTDDNLKKIGCFIVSRCWFCHKHEETSKHLFFTCPETFKLWDWLMKGTYKQLDLTNWSTLITGNMSSWSKSHDICYSTYHLGYLDREEQHGLSR